MDDLTKVAVTGASGFIGRAVLEYLAREGIDVRALSRQAAPSWARGIDWTTLSDYADPHAAGVALEGTTHLLHLADDPRRMHERDSSVPLRIADTLIAAAERTGLRGAILASTIYAREPARAGSYGTAKAGVEKRFLDSAIDQVAVLRLPPVYGPGGRGGLAVLAGLVRRGLPLPLALADAPRAYLSRRNLATLIAAIVQDRQPVHAVFEPSDGEPVATRDLIAMMSAIMGKRPMLLPVPLPLLRWLGSATGRSALVGGAIDRLEVEDTGALRKTFGWRPVERMPESLAFLAADFKSS